MAFYLGYVAAKHPDAELVVVANDGGMTPCWPTPACWRFAPGVSATRRPLPKRLWQQNPLCQRPRRSQPRRR
ncbi:MAG: hypothetical protein IPK34_01590 [Ramlibacter sp.]|nr:hypothetical protein [Ramlibacter sp.]